MSLQREGLRSLAPCSWPCSFCLLPHTSLLPVGSQHRRLTWDLRDGLFVPWRKLLLDFKQDCFKVNFFLPEFGTWEKDLIN